jgi:hypothetical protein
MKFSIKTIFAVVALAVACAEPDAVKPVPATSASDLSAEFSFINAVPDGPVGGLEFYVNNEKLGDTKTFLTGIVHTMRPITTNGIGANTNFRVKASGGIGGVLGTNDLIYRAGNNNLNNFVATATTTLAKSRYTLIAVDSINRPAPVRTLNATNFGDVTYYSSRASFTAKKKLDPLADTVIMLSIGSNNSIVTANLLRKYNGGNLPSFFVAIGLVPLGSSDPGGPRFLLLTDTYPATIGTTTTESAIRFIHASPNAPALYARLKYISGTGSTNNYTIGSNVGHIMAFPGFTPSVGSRATTSAFTLRATEGNIYDLEFATDAGFTSIVSTTSGLTFTTGKVYSVVASGIYGKTDSRKLAGGVVQHN